VFFVAKTLIINISVNEQQQRIYNLEIQPALAAFETTRQGLTSNEAQLRQQQFGRNELQAKKTSLIKRIIEPFSSAFVLVLLVALVLSIVERKVPDAIVIGVIVVVNAIIYYVQQFSVSRVLKTLKSQDVVMASVLRDGRTVQIASEDLVPGDIIHVAEGVKIPADGRLIESSQVQVDEAVLTGESMPVHKHAAALEGMHEIYDQINMLFKGCYVRSGVGLMLVTGIGNDTQLGSINTLAGSVDATRSPIERKIDKLTQKIMIATIISAAAAVALAVWRGITPEEALRFSLSLVVSAIPEGLPVALTIVLLLSARRMAKVHALVKKISSIETMGAITLIATDKTGTITQNKLSIAEQQTTHGSQKSFNEAIRASLNGSNDYAGDSLDQLLHAAVGHVELPPEWHKAKEIPFNQQLQISGVVWQHQHGATIFIKGAPERILALCTKHPQTATVEQKLEEFTGKGYRTIAFAHRDFKTMPTKIDQIELQGMMLDGLVGLADQLRDKIPEAIAEARQAGIKVVMLTGDHVATAAHIAQSVGIAQRPEQVASSAILEGGDPNEIRRALKTIRVFARVLPEHKYALLKAVHGSEITAMTGDGVNDIPALVQADTGLAMGSGTDAAKDASDIVLMDDNFRTIVSAVKVGRTALANILKMLVYLLSTSIGEVTTMLLALILGLPLPVTAIQILWVNLVTDSLVVIPLGLSPSEAQHMHQPPKNPRAPLLGKRLVSRVIIMALAVAFSVLIVFHINRSQGEETARSLAFLSLIVIQWANALCANFEYKSWIYNFIHPNKKLLVAIVGSIVLQIVAFSTSLREFIDVVPLQIHSVLIAVLIPIAAALVASDLHKFVTRKWQ
jgi:Ca2+-transporting ATPase